MKPGDIDVSDPSYFEDGFPHAYFQVLRDEAPVFWNEVRRKDDGHQIGKGFYCITRYEDIRLVSRHPETYSSARGGALLADMDEEGLALVRTMMITMDPPGHGRLRQLVQRGFAPRMIAHLESEVRLHAQEVVRSVASGGEAEFVQEIAMRLPVVLICELMGIRRGDRELVLNWVNEMVGFDDPDFGGDIARSREVAAEMWAYAQQLAAQKSAAPDGSLMSLLAGHLGEGSLSELELGNFFVMLAAAGIETTRTAASQGLRVLCENPEQLALLRSDLDRYLPGAIEEILRFTTPVTHMRRTVACDTELNGARIRRGEKVVMWYPSANRDSDIWQEADRFDITRHPNPHLAFGTGEHFCLGASMARLQLSCLFREVLMQLSDIEIVQPVKFMRSTVLQAVTEMNVKFTPSNGACAS